MGFNYNKYFCDRTNNNDFSDFDLYRIASMFAQDGYCYVTGRPLIERERELHHRKPRHYGGTDVPENLIYINKDVHLMIHTFDECKFLDLMFKQNLNISHIELINKLRVEAHRLPIYISSQITA